MTKFFAWTGRLGVLSAVALAAAGCATAPAPLERSLPPAPAFMASVAVPKLAAGQDSRVALAQHRAALLGANKRLDDSGTWYARVRKSFGAGR